MSDGKTSSTAEIQQLLEERATVQAWLNRLDEHSVSVSEKIVRRVLGDYQERFRRVLDALSTHQRALHDHLEEAERTLAGAEARRVAATDDLEEMALRTRIGEIGEEDWIEHEPLLRSAVEEAEQNRSLALAEVERLVEILAQIGDREEEVPEEVALVAETIAPMEETVVLSLGSPEIQGALALGARLEDSRVAVVGGAGSDLLEDEDSPEDEIDTVYQGYSSESAVEEEPDTSPKPGIKCSECGYTNDTTAWFCGVCGADIG
ncbi:MAG: zinc ribbon domain-containing protein [Gemmatimonadota bacterium]|jgi:hypothetical protein|nr:zinc ribbon domain-containing protein [Gemmatimonadota bacterium]